MTCWHFGHLKNLCVRPGVFLNDMLAFWASKKPLCDYVVTTSQMSRFLCMNKILVHAEHSCAYTTLLCMHWRGQGPRPGPTKKRAGPGGLFWVLTLGPGPSSACTRVLCMHKSVLRAQESCACTRIFVRLY